MQDDLYILVLCPNLIKLNYKLLLSLDLKHLTNAEWTIDKNARKKKLKKEKYKYYK